MKKPKINKKSRQKKEDKKRKENLVSKYLGKKPIPTNQREIIAKCMRQLGMAKLADAVLEGSYRPDDHLMQKIVRLHNSTIRGEIRLRKINKEIEIMSKKRGVDKQRKKIKGKSRDSKKTKRVVIHQKEENISKIRSYQRDLKNFINSKWKEIISVKRSFALDLGKEYLVKITLPTLVHLGLEELRFCQKGVQPPGVGVDLVMTNSGICRCRLDPNGSIQVADERSSSLSREYRLLFNMIAVAHYADLVVPHDSGKKQKATKSRSIKPPTEEYRIKDKVKIKAIPRVKYSTNSKESKSSERIQGVGPALIDPFRRRLPAGQKPRFEKIIEADQHGINLQGPGYPGVQYTFVRAHVRGTENSLPKYYYAHDYSVVKTLDTILNVLGVS